MKLGWFTVLATLAMLLGLVPGSAFPAPLAAQAVEPVPGPVLTTNAAVVNDDPPVEYAFSAHLPIVAAPGQPGPPPGFSYAGALSQALAHCAATALNQVCYAAGSVTLDGGGPLTTPGQTASLDGVSGLTLVSPDAAHWSVALLRLAADSPAPGLGLTLLAFGNVEIRDLTLFDALAGNGDVAPALSFSSSPVPGQDPETGGLIVYNPNHEEPLSIRLNGADLTLASSAVVQAQPGANMTVTMAAGSALVSTAAGDGALIQAHQLTVPLAGDGAAAGAPTAPTLTDEDLLEPLVSATDEDLLAPLVPRRPALQAILDKLVADFDSAHARCMQGSSRQVYRVMYFARLLKLFKAVPDDLMSLIDVQVTQCATFELEFNSVITGTSYYASGSMYVQEQGITVSYDMGGHLVQLEQGPLNHLRYDIDFAWGDCAYVVLEDGKLNLEDGYMRINRN
ncbi:MAG TPA: hypothetical protein VLC52_02245, partial [Anaerolineae bacterium]|nr:hypothetical protein [Anaerolineae bacterium]